MGECEHGYFVSYCKDCHIKHLNDLIDFRSADLTLTREQLVKAIRLLKEALQDLQTGMETTIPGEGITFGSWLGYDETISKITAFLSIYYDDSKALGTDIP